uniref:RNA-directed RNA polymerase n=1 Tax=Rhabditophanes sp. KR3021 TaxID=114890 RepID=A0AC35TLG0_9BILA
MYSGPSRSKITPRSHGLIGATTYAAFITDICKLNPETLDFSETDGLEKLAKIAKFRTCQKLIEDNKQSFEKSKTHEDFLRKLINVSVTEKLHKINQTELGAHSAFKSEFNNFKELCWNVQPYIINNKVTKWISSNGHPNDAIVEWISANCKESRHLLIVLRHILTLIVSDAVDSKEKYTFIDLINEHLDRMNDNFRAWEMEVCGARNGYINLIHCFVNFLDSTDSIENNDYFIEVDRMIKSLNRFFVDPENVGTFMQNPRKNVLVTYLKELQGNKPTTYVAQMDISDSLNLLTNFEHFNNQARRLEIDANKISTIFDEHWELVERLKIPEYFWYYPEYQSNDVSENFIHLDIRQLDFTENVRETERIQINREHDPHEILLERKRVIEMKKLAYKKELYKFFNSNFFEQTSPGNKHKEVEDHRVRHAFKPVYDHPSCANVLKIREPSKNFYYNKMIQCSATNLGPLNRINGIITRSVDPLVAFKISNTYSEHANSFEMQSLSQKFFAVELDNEEDSWKEASEDREFMDTLAKLKEKKTEFQKKYFALLSESEAENITKLSEIKPKFAFDVAPSDFDCKLNQNILPFEYDETRDFSDVEDAVYPRHRSTATIEKEQKGNVFEDMKLSTSLRTAMNRRMKFEELQKDNK